MHVNYRAKVAAHGRDHQLRRPVSLHGHIAVQDDLAWEEDDDDLEVDREDWEIDAWDGYLAHLIDGVADDRERRLRS